MYRDGLSLCQVDLSRAVTDSSLTLPFTRPTSQPHSVLVQYSLDSRGLEIARSSFLQILCNMLIQFQFVYAWPVYRAHKTKAPDLTLTKRKNKLLTSLEFHSVFISLATANKTISQQRSQLLRCVIGLSIVVIP